MAFEAKYLLKIERLYTYTSSRVIAAHCGLIGYLRADMDSNGEGFFSSWEDFRPDLKTQEFKDEFDDVINEFRKDGNFLRNRVALAAYCNANQEASFGKDIFGYEREFGVRVNTDTYAYLMRLNPNKGEYNLYCYCYRKDWLDEHLQEASKGIRFIDTHYNDLFRLQDGERVVVVAKNGKETEYMCRYIDDYHLEVGDDVYHICEFAEKMEQEGNAYEPVSIPLPAMCYSTLSASGDIIVIKRDEKGYHPYKHQFGERNREMCDQMNKNLGVSKRQEAAMQAGSMFGWDTKAANPKNYNFDGVPVKAPK